MKVVLINAPHVIDNGSTDTDYPLVTSISRLKIPKFLRKIKVLEQAIPSLVYKQLGIGYLSACLKEKGHSATYIDAQAMGMSIQAIVDCLNNDPPDMVGIPCFVLGRYLVYELIKNIRLVLPDIPIVLGGPQVTLFPEQVLSECKEVSMVLRGEADFSLSELAERIEKNLPLEDIPGIILRDSSGELHYGPPPAHIEELDSIPFPEREIYNQKLYNPMPMMLSLPYMRADQVITSRGCKWGKCRFCYQSVSGMPCYRRRSPENVIEEIKGLVANYGIEFIVFTDDDFLCDGDWIGQFCNLFDLEGFKLKWSAVGRVNTVTSEILYRVKNSGCVHVTYGFETGNQETLNLMRKGTTLKQAFNAVKWSHEAGLLVRGYIMLGLPRETPEMAEKTIRFVQELNIDYVSFAPYHVLEGTPLAVTALQEGHCVEHDNISCQIPSYVPDTYENAEQLQQLLNHAYRRFYLRPRYILRTLWSVRNFRLWPSLISKIWIGLQVTLFDNR